VTAPAVARGRRKPARSPAVGAAVRECVVGVRRPAPLAVLLATGLVLHAGMAPHLAIRGIAPDVLLVAVVAVSSNRGARAGAAFGFAAGLAADLFLATPLGTSALAYTLLGHALGRADLGRSIVVVIVGVAAGRLAAAAVATGLAGVPFPGPTGVLSMAGVAIVSAPLGPAVMAAVQRLGRAAGGSR
jgi:rod shape-determining protein MreD